MGRALFAHGAGDLRPGTVEVGEPGPGQVLVRLARGGICGSDLHYANHGGFGSVRLREPMILGHEVSGTVEALGAGVSGLSAGELVAISPSRPCKGCGECLRGLPNQCLRMRFYGSAMPFPHIQGAFRDRIVAEAEQCVSATGLSAAEAAMAEPLSVALHGTALAGSLLGHRVLVTGCGPIGLLSILVARRAGAAEIVATDIAAPALERALAAGANVAIDMAADPDGLAPYRTGKGSIDTVLECSGAEAALHAAIPAMRPRGMLIQLGLSGDMAMPMMQITAKELTLKGSFRFHEEFATAVGYMREGLVEVLPLITHSYAFDDYIDAFATANDRSRAMKVQLDFA